VSFCKKKKHLNRPKQSVAIDVLSRRNVARSAHGSASTLATVKASVLRQPARRRAGERDSRWHTTTRPAAVAHKQPRAPRTRAPAARCTETNAPRRARARKGGKRQRPASDARRPPRLPACLSSSIRIPIARCHLARSRAYLPAN
jgi:hypothetical protein